MDQTNILDSKTMWDLEKNMMEFVDPKSPLKKLYNVVDKLINNDKLTYEQFTNDIISSTSTFSDSDDKGKRLTEVEHMCKELIEKYGRII